MALCLDEMAPQEEVRWLPATLDNQAEESRRVGRSDEWICLVLSQTTSYTTAACPFLLFFFFLNEWTPGARASAKRAFFSSIICLKKKKKSHVTAIEIPGNCVPGEGAKPTEKEFSPSLAGLRGSLSAVRSPKSAQRSTKHFHSFKPRPRTSYSRALIHSPRGQHIITASPSSSSFGRRDGKREETAGPPFSSSLPPPERRDALLGRWNHYSRGSPESNMEADLAGSRRGVDRQRSGESCKRRSRGKRGHRVTLSV